MASETDVPIPATKEDDRTHSEPKTIGANDATIAYQTMVTCHEEIVHGLSQDPQAMASALHSKGFISDETLREITEVSGTNTSKGERLYSEVLGVVKVYPHRYREFIDMLQENKVLYEELLRCLQDIQQRIAQGETFQEPPSPVSIYTQHLKVQYLKQPILQDDPWPPSMGQHYINLALIDHFKDPTDHSYIPEDLLRGKTDKILHQKQNTNINEALEKCQQKTKILIDGAPGVGKTTLCRKICHNWAKGELLKGYPLLVYIPLRVPKFAKASHFEELFYHDDPDVESAVVKHIRKNRGADILFLFDGYDELSRQERERESLFLDIFNGGVLQECSVIICSRPYASNRLQRSSMLSRHIEVLGFNKEQTEECIVSGIPDPDKAKYLIDELRNRQDLLSFCYIPLNCAILIYIYMVTNCTIPNTITELFTLFIDNTFQRQNDIYGTDKALLKIHKAELAKLAHESLLEDKLAFEEDEVPSTEEARLGLMTAAKCFTSSGMVISYQFIHLTVHEYLAADWMANKLTEKEQAEFLEANLDDDRSRMVFIFLAGLTKLQGEHYLKVLSSRNLQLWQYSYCGELYLHDTAYREMHNQFHLLLHLTYEAQSQQACHALAKSVEGQVLRCELYDGNFELSIFGYFISQSNCVWKNISLIIHEFRINFICFNRFVAPFRSVSPRTSVKRFSLEYLNNKHNGGSPLPEMLWTLFETPAFRHLRCIGVSQEPSSITSFLSDYKGPSSECNETIIKHLENLQHIELDGIGFSHASQVVEESLIPIIGRCRETIKTLLLKGKEHREQWYPCFSIKWYFAFVKLIKKSSFPALEMINLDIGPLDPIHMYLPSEEVKLLKSICIATTVLLYSITSLRSLTLKGTFSSSKYFSEELTESITVDYRRTAHPF